MNWTLLKCPDDEGVRNVNGRPGAAMGPSAFSSFLAKMKGQYPVAASCREIEGLPSGPCQLEERFISVAEHVRAELAALNPLVVVGGGHDYAYPLLWGASQAFADQRVGCLNIDAHFDLRPSQPKVTSGSPFYLAIESGCLKGERLVEFGIQRHANSPELFEYALAHEVEVLTFESLRDRAVTEFKAALDRLSQRTDVIVLSWDLDALAESFAPGVSAPQAEGFTTTELFEMLRISAANPKVIALGLFELSPPLDQDQKTVRLAATGVYHWISEKMRLTH